MENESEEKPENGDAENEEASNDAEGTDDKNNEETNEEESDANSPPKLFVGRLPSGTKENQLKELFSTYGEVTHCDIVGKYGFVVSVSL